MWAVGVLALAGVSVVIGQGLARRGQTAPRENLWDLPRTTSTYTSIVGMLAGFTVVVTMFFANLTVARASPAYETVIGMLLLAFLLFVGSAMQFGTTPNLADRSDEDYRLIQRFSYQLANLGYFCAISASWLSLKLFLEAIGLPNLAGIFAWVLLAALFAGCMRMAEFTFRMSTLNRASCFAVPFLAFGLVAAYRQLVSTAVPQLLPGTSEPFLVAVGLFLAGAIGFECQSAIIMGDVERVSGFLRRAGDRIILAYLQVIAMLVAMLWFAVAKF